MDEDPTDYSWLEGEAETIVLSQRDWDLFVAILERPPAPNEVLRNAWERFQKEVDAGHIIERD